MKSELTCIIVDDQPQKTVYESAIVNKMKKEGYSVKVIQLNPKDPKAMKNNKLNIETFKKYVIENLENIQKTEQKKIDIIATDFKFDDEKIITGIHVIDIFYNYFNSKGYDPKLILYSGNKEQVINYIIEVNTEPIPNSKDRILREKSKLTDQIRDLMLYKISDFVLRDDYSERVNYYCKKACSTSFKDNLKEKFMEHKEKKVRFPEEFKGKKFEELLKHIEKDNAEGRKFIEQYIDLFIDHIIDIN